MTRRKTQLRNTIFEVIQNSDGHMTADQIHAYLRTQGVNLGLATVYRNLNVLFDDGLIHRVKHPDFGFIYDKNTKQHHHFVCTQCGHVEDVDVDLDTQALMFARKSIHGEVRSYTLFFNGLCDECLKKR